MNKKNPIGKHRLVGLFPDTAGAERAFQACVDRGYEIGDVNVVMSESTRKELSGDERKPGAELAKRKAEGGELGGPSGGRVGILVTIFAAMGAAVAVPALGFVLAGPVAVALTAAGAVGIAAGLIAALGDWGVPKDRIEKYEAAVKKGQVLMMLETRDEQDARAIEKRWQEIGGRDIHYS